MSDPMTDEDIRAAMTRAEGATEGPWTVLFRPSTELDAQRYESEYGCLVMGADCDQHAVADTSCNHTCRLGYQQNDNARFIAAARMDVPALAAECLRRGEEIARLVSGIRAVLGNDEGRISTHYTGCEGTHWRCGLRKLLREVGR